MSIFNSFSSVHPALKLSSIICNIWKDLVNYILFKKVELRREDTLLLMQKSYNITMFTFITTNSQIDTGKMHKICNLLTNNLSNQLLDIWKNQVPKAELNKITANFFTTYSYWQAEILSLPEAQQFVQSFDRQGMIDAALNNYLNDISNWFFDNCSGNFEKKSLSDSDYFNIHKFTVNHISKYNKIKIENQKLDTKQEFKSVVEGETVKSRFDKTIIKNQDKLSEFSEQGSPEAQFLMGLNYAKGIGVEKNYVEAVKFYKKAAIRGNDLAQFALGYWYLNGVGVLKNDKLAFKWLNMSAEQGNINAQESLSRMYLGGIGVDKDNEKAIMLCRLAAEHGMVDAQILLSSIYYDGVIISKDDKEAFNWLNMAAEHGNLDAIYKLGVFYVAGIGVVENSNKGLMLIKEAAENGHLQAQFTLYNNE